MGHFPIAKLLPDRLKAFTANLSYLSFSFLLVYSFGYVFHGVLSRKIGPISYGEFSAIYALLVALSRPAGILVSAVARISLGIDETDERGAQVLHVSKRLALISSTFFALIPICLYPFLRTWLKVQGIELYAIVSITLMAWAWLNVIRGLLLASEDFLSISFIGVLETFSRASIGIILVLLGAGVMGALGSSAIGAFFALWFGAKRVGVFRERRPCHWESLKVGDFWSTTGKVFIIAMPVGFFQEMDVMLAKRFFHPDFAGLYASCALVGKGLLAFGAVFSTLIYPKLVRAQLSKEGLREFLYGVGFVFLVFVIGFFLAKIFRKEIVFYLFGREFWSGAEILPYYVIAILPLAIHCQLMNYMIAVGGIKEGFWLWITLLVYYFLLELFSSSWKTYLSSLFIAHIFFTLIGFVILFYGKFRRSECIN